MAKKNWFIEANKSTDPAVKALLEQYNTLDANAPDAEEKRKALSQEIKGKLGLVEPTATENDQGTPGDQGGDTDADNDAGSDDADNSDDSDEEKAHKATIAKLEPMFEKLAALDPSYERTGFETVEEVEALIAAAEKAGDKQDTPATPEKPTFPYTEDDATKAKDIKILDKIKKACREEIDRLEKTRLKHGTYKQNHDLDMEIWKFRRIIGLSLKRESALKERAHRLAKMGRISNLAIKRARFVKLHRQGISITNITKHPEGVAKDELIEVLDEATIEACRKNKSNFPEMWDAWKKKFIDLPAKIAEYQKINPEYKVTGTETIDQVQSMIDKAQEK